MSNAENLKSLGRGFNNSWRAIFLFTAMALGIVAISLMSSQARAQDTEVIVSPRIDLFVGTGDQGWYGRIAAFDSINNRFLVVWTDGGVETSEIDLYGQLVNADGTLNGSPIAICTLSGQQQIDPQTVFDPVNGRFLVIWMDGRNGLYNIYGQLVNADGSLYGSDFAVSPIPPSDYHRAAAPAIQFDTQNNRFLVVWTGPSAYHPTNLYGQFVNLDGSRYGPMIQITDYTNYSAANPHVAFDQNNSRFLATWGNQFDGYVYGRLVNTNGTLHGSEIPIGYYGLGYSYVPSLSVDSVNSRFLQVWTGMKGQLINADGSLYGNEISFNLGVATDNSSVVFDTANNKFLVTAAIQSPYIGIVGQLLNPDGNLDGPGVKIFDMSDDLDREGYMGSYPPFAAFGSAETGSLVIYMDIPYWTTSRYDIFGTFVKVGNLPPVADAGDDQSVSVGELVTLDGSGSYDPDEDYPLSYQWTMTSQPAGSTAALTNDNTVSPTFTPDVDGDYTIELVVTDSLEASSEPDEVFVTASVIDTDSDGIPNNVETATGTDPFDDDTDDDGLLDGSEDVNANGIVDAGETDPRKPDTDGDKVQDGTEKGLTAPQGNHTNMAIFIPDADPFSTTDPLNSDTDGEGLTDGQEDRNANGALDTGETSPILEDTDGDSYTDWEEVKAGSDPLEFGSIPPLTHRNPHYGVNRSGATYAIGDCAHCHDTFNDSTCSDNSFMLFASNSPPWSQADNFCYQCHKGTGSVQEGGITNYDYSKAFGGAPTDVTNIYDAFNTPGAHDLGALLSDAVTNHPEWGFTPQSNPCTLCHSTHRAEQNFPVQTTGALNTAIRRPSHNMSTDPDDFLWGDDEDERMAAYAASSGGVYQPPYFGDTTSGRFEPTGTTTDYGGSRTPDYVTFCLDCHQDDNDPDLFHSMDWTNAVHGLADDIWLEQAPAPPYSDAFSKNYVLSCLDCHEPHGYTRRMISGVQVSSGWEACYTVCHTGYY